MKPSNVCLPTSEIPLLLSGDLPPDELAGAESHIAECETCRSAIESMIADSRWWNDARHSLAASTTHSANRSDAAHDSEPTTNEQMLELLGPTDDPAMLGRIGVYEIVGILGHGGMGVVFKGYDVALHRSVAIKMLLPHLAASGAARKRFAREAQAAAAVVDDHVMAIHGVSEWKSVPYFVMPYARGLSLQKRLSQNGPLEVREILRIGMQAAKGLAAAHAQGLVHRDVKPANIFLAEGVERVQLMDFGLARAVDDASLTRSGTLAGTPQYMSPEQARAETVDHRSDLFSLGSVLYAMCTGHAPFRAESSYSVLRLITDKEPRPIREINPDIPEWLCAIISKLMAKNADDRFASAQEVAELLEECLAHIQQPITTPLPFIPEPTALAAGRVDNKRDLTQQRSPEASADGSRIGRLGRWLVAAAFAFLVFAGVLIILETNKGTLTIESEVDDVPIRITQGNKVVEQLTVSTSGKTVRVSAGSYRIEIAGEFPEISVVNGVVSMKRGETQNVTIAMKQTTTAHRDRPQSEPYQSDTLNHLRDNETDQAAVVPAIAVAKAVAFLMAQQKSDGRWPEAESVTGGTAALAMCASLQAGIPADDPVLEKGLATLRAAELQQTYVVSLQTIALCLADRKGDAELIRQHVAWLEKAQCITGGWRYTLPAHVHESSGGDGSNTRFAVWSLHEAVRAGYDVRRETWLAVRKFWGALQSNDGGFGYTLRSPSTQTMTLAGIGCLAMANEHLGLPFGEENANDESIQLALQWCDQRPWLATSTTWFFYHAHTIERAGHTNGLGQIASRNWLTELMPALMKRQKPDGSFYGDAKTESPVIATSFALLALTGREESQPAEKVPNTCPTP